MKIFFPKYWITANMNEMKKKNLSKSEFILWTSKRNSFLNLLGDYLVCSKWLCIIKKHCFWVGSQTMLEGFELSKMIICFVWSLKSIFWPTFEVHRTQMLVEIYNRFASNLVYSTGLILTMSFVRYLYFRLFKHLDSFYRCNHNGMLRHR